MAQNHEHISTTNIIDPSCRERFLPLELREAEQLRRCGVSMGGISRLTPPYEMSRRPSPFHAILCTTEGAGLWRSDHARGEMLPDSVWFLPAGTDHNYQISGQSWTLHWFHLSAGAGWKCEGVDPVLIGPVLPGLEDAMWGLIGEEHSTHRDTGPLREQYSALIVLLLQRLTGEERDMPGNSKGVRLSEQLQKVSGNLRHPWTVDELAASMHVSVAHLHRLYRKHYNATPMQCVTAQRMLHGKMLLQYTDYPLSVIADRTGYQTPFSFSKAFKRWSGMSPRQCRARGTAWKG